MELDVLAGSVCVLGYIVLQEQQKSYKIFSPSTSSLITLEECGNLKSTATSQERDSIQKLLKTQGKDVVKKGTLRAKKAAAVLLFRTFTSLEADFVCQFPPFQEIFSSNVCEVQHCNYV